MPFCMRLLVVFWLLCVKTSTSVWALGWWMVDGIVIGLDGFVNSSCVFYMISWQDGAKLRRNLRPNPAVAWGSRSLS